MVRRKGERTAKQVERDYPHVVAFRVPPRGLGLRLHRLHGWCAARRVDYASMPFRIGQTDFACFCFKSEELAQEFQLSSPRI